jgi:hypothetical protein
MGLERRLWHKDVMTLNAIDAPSTPTSVIPAEAGT